MWEVSLPIITAVLGFLAKSAFDAVKARRDLRFGKKLAILEDQLSKFYWPLHICMQKDNAMWPIYKLRWEGKTEADRAVGKAVEANFVIPNHLEAVSIIQRNIHLSRADEKLEALLLQYIRHVTAFSALRSSGDERDPIDLEQKYSGEFGMEIERTAKRLQAEYDALISRKLA